MQCDCRVCMCVHVRWDYIHTYVVLYVYTRGMHIIEMLPLVLLCVTSYSLLNLQQFGAWNGAKDWKSSRFCPSPLSRSGSRSQAVLHPHHACMWASVTTIPSTHAHRRSHTSTERPSVYPKVELEAFIFQGKIDPVSFFFAL